MPGYGIEKNIDGRVSIDESEVFDHYAVFLQRCLVN
jgi:hypothetical protein